MGTVANDGATWDEQWGNGDDNGNKTPTRYKKKTGGNNMEKMKVVAKKSFTKAKKVTKISAVAVKIHAKHGINWIKMQYRKRTSKKD